jgi:hypothetical protein
MLHRSLAALFAAATLVSSTTAQDSCPHQVARHVEASLQIGPEQACGSVEYQIGGLSVQTGRGGCPLFAIYTPPHDLAVPGERRTRVESVALQPITQVFFRCQQDWFLFFPVGSSCTLDRTVNVGTVAVLVTRQCTDSSVE